MGMHHTRTTEWRAWVYRRHVSTTPMIQVPRLVDTRFLASRLSIWGVRKSKRDWGTMECSQARHWYGFNWQLLMPYLARPAGYGILFL